MLTAEGELVIDTPEWAEPLLAPSRYKGAKGGRGSGKSHFFAELLVEAMVADVDLCAVCIREIQKSLKFSAKKLIGDKIRALGVSHLFRITEAEIRRIGGEGICIFQGMQDHTAESIKSLEGFKIAWCEESQSLSSRSIELLLPTIIRSKDAQVWFSWNPNQDDDPVDKLLVENYPASAIVVHVNFTENIFCPEATKELAADHLKYDPETYDHVWLGGYNTKSDDQVLSGKWRVDEFEPTEDWDGPYFGADWGFSTDPNTLMELYISDNTLYVYTEVYGHGIEIDDTPAFFDRNPRAKTHTIRADCARPEIISYMQKHGYPKVEAAKKWPGSVEDGISKLRSFKEIVIHVQCKHTQEEARLWKYKRDRLTGDVLPILIDKHDHCFDGSRYAIGPLIKGARIRRAAV
jgi:phage terminase large subunit